MNSVRNPYLHEAHVYLSQYLNAASIPWPHCSAHSLPPLSLFSSSATTKTMQINCSNPQDVVRVHHYNLTVSTDVKLNDYWHILIVEPFLIALGRWYTRRHDWTTYTVVWIQLNTFGYLRLIRDHVVSDLTMTCNITVLLSRIFPWLQCMTSWLVLSVHDFICWWIKDVTEMFRITIENMKWDCEIQHE